MIFPFTFVNLVQVLLNSSLQLPTFCDEFAARSVLKLHDEIATLTDRGARHVNHARIVSRTTERGKNALKRLALNLTKRFKFIQKKKIDWL